MNSHIKRTFSIDVTKDHLVFSAGHFITIGDFCERLHGHNFRLAANIEGPLDENGFVFDFIALRDELQRVCDSLDHRMLLPLLHPEIHVDIQEREVEVKYSDRRWVFPKDECILLPIKQTTVEMIAEWIGLNAISRLKVNQMATLTIKLEENFGQWANCRFDLPLSVNSSSADSLASSDC
ncbi:6-pyruvoyl trahydropterin synthase family protein [Planctomicrobium sp. SH527]|uniref:6-pyruvoyl trahydropterin synthase family protein n=1 Tax=Planctomicrobium sp. SH527 TaxID=3448123 RepID=UPI003F5C1657